MSTLTPEYEDFLRGPIPISKRLITLCHGCGSVQVMWSPNVGGVLVCPYCNTRLLNQFAQRP